MIHRPILLCQNPACGIEILEYKSSKRKYCTSSCKNQHGHQKRNLINAKTIAIYRGMLDNYKLLNFYKSAGIYKLNIDEITKLGFNGNHIPNKTLLNHHNKKIEAFLINDLYFYFEKDTNSLIIIP